jgi:hypothetical protein
MYLPIKHCCRRGAGWASAGKSVADADHVFPEEVLLGGGQHAVCGVQLALGRQWCGLREAVSCTIAVHHGYLSSSALGADSLLNST